MFMGSASTIVENVRVEESVFTTVSAENAFGAVTPYLDVARTVRKNMIAWNVVVGASVPTNDEDVDAKSVLLKSVDRPRDNDWIVWQSSGRNGHNANRLR